MPLELNIVTTGLNQLGQQFSLLAHDSARREAIYVRVLENLGKTLVLNLMARTPIGVSGTLRDSTRFRVVTLIHENITEFKLQIIQAAYANGFDYQPIVVHGRLPGLMPPPLALRGWVMLKWGLDTVQATIAAQRLAVHIGRFGTSSNNYTLLAIEDSQGALTEAANSLGLAFALTIADVPY